MDKSAPPTLFFVLFPFFFAAMWCAISLLLSAVGGWRRLAKRFPASSQPTGRRFFMLGGRFGLVTYGGCLTVYSSPEGLYLSVLLPFRIGHPPLFIPWSAIRNATTRRFLWAESIVFEVGSPSIANVQLPRKVFEGHDVLG